MLWQRQIKENNKINKMVYGYICQELDLEGEELGSFDTLPSISHPHTHPALQAWTTRILLSNWWFWRSLADSISHDIFISDRHVLIDRRLRFLCSLSLFLLFVHEQRYCGGSPHISEFSLFGCSLIYCVQARFRRIAVS